MLIMNETRPRQTLIALDQQPSNKLQLMSVCLAVGEMRSFAAAARRLALSPASVTRAVVNLEDYLGVKLFSRSTRSIELTEAGERYLGEARRILRQLEEADDNARSANLTPQGELVVAAPAAFGTQFIVPVVSAYLARFPQMHVVARLVEHAVNVAEDNVDVAVSIGHLPDSNLRAVTVGHACWVTCAAPAYLRAHGAPAEPGALGGHAIIAAEDGGGRVEWKYSRQGEEYGVRLHPRMVFSTPAAMLEAALSGLGIVRLPDYQVSALLGSGRLVAVLEEFEGPCLPIQVVHREGRLGAVKTRAFIDLLVAHLQQNLPGRPRAAGLPSQEGTK